MVRAAKANIKRPVERNDKIKEDFFLPYQQAWLKDNSRLKIYEKSRRIGATYVQAYEDIVDCIVKPGLEVYFSSADESAARLYIEYCVNWARFWDAVFKNLGEQVIDKEKDIKAFTIELSPTAGGKKSRIMALSSNPKAFRSKGGKVVLDEFAHHENAEQLWKAARPCITWGFDMRILSTHNGKNSLFYRILKETGKGTTNFSFHTTDIYQAIKDGLLDKIKGCKTTQKEREEWLNKERLSCLDHETWEEEYCCNPVDSATAFITYAMISACESDICLWPDGTPINRNAELYLGFDVSRRGHLSVISLLEKLGEVKYIRRIIEMHNKPFRKQREVLFSFLPFVQRACIDETGIGMQLAEEAEEAFGTSKIEKVYFTTRVREELAYPLRSCFEDQGIRVPPSRTLREDLHSVRKVTTASGNVRLDTREINELDESGKRFRTHGDRFWSIALANHASLNADTLIEYQSTKKIRKSSGFQMGNFLRI